MLPPEVYITVPALKLTQRTSVPALTVGWSLECADFYSTRVAHKKKHPNLCIVQDNMRIKLSKSTVLIRVFFFFLIEYHFTLPLTVVEQ